MNQFQKRFEELLAEKGLSQREFARKYKMPQATVNSWFNGHEPSLNYLIDVAKIFSVSTDFLLGIVDY